MHWPFFRGSFQHFDNNAVRSAGIIVIHDISATVTGTGSLTASVYLDIPITAIISGTGTLTAAVTVDVIAAATLSGTGSLTSAVSIDIITGAVLSGTGSATGAVSLEISTSAALTGSGALTSSVVLDIPTAATISGTGTLTAGVTTQPEIHADMPGNGSLTATVTVQGVVLTSGGGKWFKPSRYRRYELPKYDRVIPKKKLLSVAGKLAATLAAKVGYVVNNVLVNASLVAKVSVDWVVRSSSIIYVRASLIAKSGIDATLRLRTKISARSTLLARRSSSRSIIGTAVSLININAQSRFGLSPKTRSTVTISRDDEELALLFGDIAEFLSEHETDEAIVGVK